MHRGAMALDLLAVLVFVAIGRSVHGHPATLAGLVSTAWPFVAGLALGWLVVSLRRASPVDGARGVIVVLATVGAGMVLRVISGQGTAFAFVLVALGFLGAEMLGWRALVRVLANGRARR